MNNDDDQFRALYGVDPTIRIEAPGRVNLIGEHIDYLDGWVMPAAIEQRVTLLATPNPVSECVEIWSEARSTDGIHQFSTTDFSRRTDPNETWLNYVIGVNALYHERGARLPGCRIALFSTIPAGAGLSSSAALETAVALLIEELSGIALSVPERAKICQMAEHKWVGVPCGIMDQMAVGGGVEDHVLQIDCLDSTYEAVPIPEGVSLVVADTGVKHALDDGEYRARREDCEEARKILGMDSWRRVTGEVLKEKRQELGPKLFRRGRHAVTEIARVQRFAAALREGRLEELGTLMREGHESLRDDFEVSCAELDCLVEAGYDFGPDRGQIGSRMTGGGFGGSTVHLVQEKAAPALRRHLRDRYKQTFNRELNCFVTKASDGAKCVTDSRKV